VSVNAAVSMGLVAAMVVFSPAGADPADPPVRLGSVESGIVLLLSDPEAGLDVPALKRFYCARSQAPVWTGSDGPLPQALAVFEAMSGAADEGLRPADYRPWLGEMLNGRLTILTRAWVDVLLTDALLRYVRDLGSGRSNPREADPEWLIPYRPLDPVAWLRQALREDDLARALADLPPRHPFYLGLRSALAEYRAMARVGDWPRIPDGPLLRPGEVDSRVSALAERLRREGRFTEPIPRGGDAYGPELETAVRAFQARNGLKVDGILGPETRAALNVSPAERVEQIRTNMERWRWLPRDLGERYILVNLGGFGLWLYQDEEVVFQTRVIAGRADRQSPSFSTRVLGVQVNPEWVVPRKIAVKDLLPQQRRNPEYLANKRIHVFRRDDGRPLEVAPVDIDWSRPYRLGYFPFTLRQEPGPHNSLGRLKLLMPNPYSIYLHDTPTKALFDKHQRDFSSGCIRVQAPQRLAALLLDPEHPSKAARRIRELVESGDTISLRFPRSVPVYLLYLTAWVDEAGQVQLRRDIYGRDRLTHLEPIGVDRVE